MLNAIRNADAGATNNLGAVRQKDGQSQRHNRLKTSLSSLSTPVASFGGEGTQEGCLHHIHRYVVDRKKDMIKTGGENVASREVEETLYAHPAVAEVAVFGVLHPRWVEAVAIAVIPHTGQTLTEDELIVFCRERLAGYKTPKYVVIVDELPKNASGKILKRELRSTYATLAETEKGAP